jgi:predicted amidohydrolase
MSNVGSMAYGRQVRVACVQWRFDRVDGFEAFADKVRRFVAIAADQRADFVVFPELYTLEILSAEPSPLPGATAIEACTAHTAALRALYSEAAAHRGINLIGGTHATRNERGDIRNVCFVALRDGTLHAREKIHATPNERDAWNIAGGDQADVIDTDCGPIGIAICYDSEFPELGRHLCDQGALIVFVPFCTDDRRGYLRVRYACAARAIENQCYVAMSGVTGILRGVGNMDACYAQSAILTPSDHGFARDGIAVEASPEVETVIVADLDLHTLLEAREHGTVRNLADRRDDLYETHWKGR